MQTGMDVKVGDEVFVQQIGYGKGPADLIPAKVTKVARVWLDIEEIDGFGRIRPRTWHLRRDTQNEGRDDYYQARFRTPDQAKQEKDFHAAVEVLKVHGIDIRPHSRWRSPSQYIALAAAVEILAAKMDKTADGESADGVR